ncbi:MAG: PfkB family carbohydrate kinase [Verrucomicrobiota bacterium]
MNWDQPFWSPGVTQPSSNRPCRHPPPIEPDPTGCGDIYLAGLVYARLHLGKDWAEAVRIATIAAGLNCQHQGVYAPSSNEIWGEMGRGFADG